jgi:hypothetical protein
VDWAVNAGDLDVAMRIPAALSRPMALIPKLGLTEVPALVLDGMPEAEGHPSYPAVAGGAAFALFLQGAFDAAVALGRRAVAAERPGSPPDEIARHALVQSLLYGGNAPEALHVAEEMVVAAEGWGDPWLRIVARNTATAMQIDRRGGNLDDLRAFAAETLSMARQLDNPTALMLASFTLGVAESYRDPAAAIGPLRESLEAFDRWSAGGTFEVIPTGQLCRCYASVGDVVRAASTIRRGLFLARDSGSRTTLAYMLEYAGQTLIILDFAEEGATLVAAAAQGRRTLGAGRSLDRHVAAEQQARTRLGQDGYDNAVRRGSAMTYEAAITYTLNTLDQLVERPDAQPVDDRSPVVPP